MHSFQFEKIIVKLDQQFRIKIFPLNALPKASYFCVYQDNFNVVKISPIMMGELGHFLAYSAVEIVSEYPESHFFSLRIDGYYNCSK